MEVKQRIKVRASVMLGTEAMGATVVEELEPVGSKGYPRGLLLVRCDDEPLDEEPGTTVDYDGNVYCGPPLGGFLVMFP